MRPCLCGSCFVSKAITPRRVYGLSFGAVVKVGNAFFSALLLLAVTSIALWAVVLVALVTGSHGELLVCRPLFQEPDFTVLTELFDTPDRYYGHGKPGLLANLGYQNDTLDIPIRTVLA
jgi:hypothetical protein